MFQWKKCTALLLKPSKLPLLWEHAQPSSHSPGLTSWFSWDLTCSSSELLQVFCQGCRWRSLSNDWPLETKPCHGAEHLGSPCVAKLTLPHTQPGSVLPLCWLSFPAVRLPSPTTAHPDGNTPYPMEHPKTCSSPPWKRNHCNTQNTQIIRWWASLGCYDNFYKR